MAKWPWVSEGMSGVLNKLPQMTKRKVVWLVVVTLLWTIASSPCCHMLRSWTHTRVLKEEILPGNSTGGMPPDQTALVWSLWCFRNSNIDRSSWQTHAEPAKHAICKHKTCSSISEVWVSVTASSIDIPVAHWLDTTQERGWFDTKMLLLQSMAHSPICMFLCHADGSCSLSQIKDLTVVTVMQSRRLACNVLTSFAQNKLQTVQKYVSLNSGTDDTRVTIRHRARSMGSLHMHQSNGC